MSDVGLSLFAVHLGDALADPWWIGGYVGLAVLLLYAVWTPRRETVPAPTPPASPIRRLLTRAGRFLGQWRPHEEEIPRIGVLSAAFFVTSSIHIPLGVLPTSVHLILNGLVGVILGRRAPLALSIGIALQFWLLQHGGGSTIGINSCIVSLPALAAGWLYPLLRRAGVPAFARGVLLGGGAVAGAVLLNFFVLLVGGKDSWERLAQLVLIAHIPVVIVEGLMLGVLVRYLEKVKPELLNSSPPPTAANDNLDGEPW